MGCLGGGEEGIFYRDGDGPTKGDFWGLGGTWGRWEMQRPLSDRHATGWSEAARSPVRWGGGSGGLFHRATSRGGTLTGRPKGGAEGRSPCALPRTGLWWGEKWLI